MHHWPKEDRPRERLLLKGEHTLSNSELLAILLRTGVKGKSALDLAREILNKFGTFREMGHADMTQWKAFKGLGSAKITQIRAAIEIARRFQEEKIKDKDFRIESPKDVIALLMPRMRDLRKEVVKVVLLNAQNKVIDIIEAEEGTVNYANPILREIFKVALEKFASSMICVHNHPAGDPTPSPEDKDFTRRLYQAGRIMQVSVLDHIIIGDDRYYSFADEKQLG